jgi:hypothetical protein
MKRQVKEFWRDFSAGVKVIWKDWWPAVSTLLMAVLVVLLVHFILKDINEGLKLDFSFSLKAGGYIKLECMA